MTNNTAETNTATNPNLETINRSCYGVVDSVLVDGAKVTVKTSFQAFEGDGDHYEQWTERETVTFEWDAVAFEDLNDQIIDEVGDALSLYQWGNDGDDDWRDSERRQMGITG